MKKLYTIGYGGRSKEQFQNILKENDIGLIIDIRARPTGFRGCYTNYNDKTKGIEKMLHKAGIKYIWYEKLGNKFRFSKDWEEMEMRYTRYLNEIRESLVQFFESIHEQIECSSTRKGICIMCAEKNPERCHRSIVAKFFEKEGVEIINLV